MLKKLLTFSIIAIMILSLIPLGGNAADSYGPNLIPNGNFADYSFWQWRGDAYLGDAGKPATIIPEGDASKGSALLSGYIAVAENRNYVLSFERKTVGSIHVVPEFYAYDTQEGSYELVSTAADLETHHGVDEWIDVNFDIAIPADVTHLKLIFHNKWSDGVRAVTNISLVLDYNLILNSGFENGTSWWGFGGGAFIYNELPATCGNNGSAHVGMLASFGSTISTSKIPVTEDKVYKLTFFSSHHVVVCAIGWEAIFYDSGGALLAADGTSGLVSDGTGAWLESSFEFASPTGAVSAEIVFSYGDDEGFKWWNADTDPFIRRIDDVSLLEIGDKIDDTDYSIYPNIIPNGDFDDSLDWYIEGWDSQVCYVTKGDGPKTYVRIPLFGNYLSVTVPVTEGNNYAFVFWSSHHLTECSIDLAVAFSDDGDVPIGEGISDTLKGSDGVWYRHVYKFTAPAGAKSAQFKFSYGDADNFLWWDQTMDQYIRRIADVMLVDLSSPLYEILDVVTDSSEATLTVTAQYNAISVTPAAPVCILAVYDANFNQLKGVALQNIAQGDENFVAVEGLAKDVAYTFKAYLWENLNNIGQILPVLSGSIDTSGVVSFE